MTSEYKSEQEAFWAGEFGATYVERNCNSVGIAYRTALFAQILKSTCNISSALELGANIGYNLLALKNLLPNIQVSAVEINQTAIEHLKTIQNSHILSGSIFDFSATDLGVHDLTFTCGVLIHINPDLIEEVYERLYQCSSAYILINEYYNSTPITINYRGHTERLFKRDFAGEMLDKYPDLTLLDYGFQYHRDHNFPADDMTWFLLKKKHS